MNKEHKLNRAGCKKLIAFQLFYVLFVRMFISWFGLPSALTYVTDFVTVVLLIMLIHVRFRRVRKSRVKYVQIMVGLFIGAAVFGDVLNVVNPLLILWAARNVFRGLVFFLACIEFLDREDIDRLFRPMLFVQGVNIAMTGIQYFQGYDQDFLGGIFGTEVGCNSYTNVFFVILLTFYAVGYLNKTQPFKRYLYVTLSTMIISALAELKIFYAEFIVIMILSILFSRRSKRKLWVAGFGFIAVVLGVFIISRIFPLQFYYMKSLRNIFKYDLLFNEGLHMSRFTAFARIDQMFFHGDPWKLLFGIGFGNAEMSAFSFLTSDFFRMYSTSNYRWFAHTMFFIEDGYVGLVFFAAIFVAMFITAVRLRSRKDEDPAYYSAETYLMIMSLLTLLGLMYDLGIRTEAQYLTYFALSAGFVYARRAENPVQGDVQESVSGSEAPAEEAESL